MACAHVRRSQLEEQNKVLGEEYTELLKKNILQISIRMDLKINEMREARSKLQKQLIKRKLGLLEDEMRGARSKLQEQLNKMEQELLETREEIERLSIERDREGVVEELETKQKLQEEKVGKGKGRNARKRKSKQIIKYDGTNTNEESECDNVDTKLEAEPVKTPANRDVENTEKIKRDIMRRLEDKQKEAAEDDKSVDLLIEEKSLEMADLILKEEIIIEDQINENAKLFKIEEAMKSLDLKKLETLKALDHSKSKLNEVNDKKERVGQFIDNLKVEAKNKSETLQKEIEELNKNISNYAKEEVEETNNKISLNAKETSSEAKGGKSRLEEFLERQVAALEEELECPVCLEVLTTSPLYKCAEDHLICPGCRPKVESCPQCRETYPRGEFRRFRGAERQAQRLVGLYEERKSLMK